MTLHNQNHTKKSFLQKIFSSQENNAGIGIRTENTLVPSELHSDSSVRSFFPSFVCSSMHRLHQQSLSVFVATWNVGGKSPNDGINLNDFLQIYNPSEIYVLGFQEIVPLNAGNVLVVEDNEPAAKWLSSINKSLNQPHGSAPRKKKAGGSLPFQKPCFKKYCDSFRTESRRKLKSCNCSPFMHRKYSKDSCLPCPQTSNEGDYSSDEEDDESEISTSSLKYGLVMAKQMVGIFLTIWARREIISSIGHLRVSCIGRGIMGCLGNKGCISVSMTIHQTSLCIVCSHLASGEKEGDELRRNADVMEILKTTQFPRICRSSLHRVPEKIVNHDKVIWLGDLNYRIALSYSETRKLLEKLDWDTLFSKDQLKIERESGRIFNGWKEGKIYFAPTYKYSYNSDVYAGETAETKNKRRTPAWCDRILWRGRGIRQLNYDRLESRFSDHRPVCSTFLLDVDVAEGSAKREYYVEAPGEEYMPLAFK